MKILTNPRSYSLCTAAVILFVCGLTASAATRNVFVGGDAPVFNPANVTIQAGDTVNWVWASVGFSHSVTSGVGGTPDGLFDSGIHKDPFTFSFTFRMPGRFLTIASHTCRWEWSAR